MVVQIGVPIPRRLEHVLRLHELVLLELDLLLVDSEVVDEPLELGVTPALGAELAKLCDQLPPRHPLERIHHRTPPAASASRRHRSVTSSMASNINASPCTWVSMRRALSSIFFRPTSGKSCSTSKPSKE